MTPYAGLIPAPKITNDPLSAQSRRPLVVALRLPMSQKRGFSGRFRRRMVFMLPAVLLVAHVLQPVDDLAVEGFLDGDVRHRRRRSCPVPVPHARREPDHVAGTDLLDRAALLLHPAQAGRDDERLTQGVGMPGCPAPGLEGDGVA